MCFGHSSSAGRLVKRKARREKKKKDMDTSLLSRFMPRIAFPWAGRAPTVCAHCFFFGLVWAGTKGLEDGGSGGAAGVVNRKYVVVGVYSLQPQCRRQRRTRPRRPCLVSRAAIFVLAALCVLRESVETADLCVCVCVCVLRLVVGRGSTRRVRDLAASRHWTGQENAGNDNGAVREWSQPGGACIRDQGAPPKCTR